MDVRTSKGIKSALLVSSLLAFQDEIAGNVLNIFTLHAERALLENILVLSPQSFAPSIDNRYRSVTNSMSKYVFKKSTICLDPTY